MGKGLSCLVKIKKTPTKSFKSSVLIQRFDRLLLFCFALSGIYYTNHKKENKWSHIKDGRLLGGIECKTGGSPYPHDQFSKDQWLMREENYPNLTILKQYRHIVLFPL